MHTIFFLPLHPTSWHEMKPVYDALKKIKSVHPIILVSKEIIKNILTDSNIADSDILYLQNIIPKNGTDKKKTNHFNVMQRINAKKYRFTYHLLRILKSRFMNSNIGIKYLTAIEIKQHKESYDEIKHVFSRLSPKAIIVSGDRHTGYEPAVLRACRKFNIPSIIIPISYTAGKESLPFSRTGKKYNADLFPKIKKAFPAQYMWYAKKQKNIYFYPPYVLKALSINDMLPANPWVMGGGHSTYILADSEESKKRYELAGCNPDKIIITGHGSHDILYEHFQKRNIIKKKLYKNYKMQNKKPLVVIALPQLAEHNLLDWSTHWKEIRFLLDVFDNLDANCIISLHPKMDKKKYSFIENDYNIPLANERLASFFSVADIFVSTFSSTIQWAVLCKIPAVVFDFYNFNYSIYDYLKGVHIINKKKDLKPELDSLISNSEYYARMSAAQAKMAGYLSPFDGKCMERIVNFILKTGTPDNV